MFKDFLNSNKAGGILLLVCVCLSLTLANSSAAEGLKWVLAYPIGIENELIDLPLSAGSFINDGLMAVFFLLVGLEIKRELLSGELSSMKKASLPVIAAVGGMLVPALFFVLINLSSPTLSGWGIPMATDIAFALAIIALLGNKVPLSIKIFLTALAIVDDLGAILVIAIFYTNEIHFNYLFIAGITVSSLVLLNVFGVRKLIFYLIPGLFLWYFIHHSGIHATIAGVVVAFTIPSVRKNDGSPLE
ncbi:MAG: Na+/H+ antiporter NhaA, partial [Pedobacter sp.]